MRGQPFLFLASGLQLYQLARLSTPYQDLYTPSVLFAVFLCFLALGARVSHLKFGALALAALSFCSIWIGIMPGTSPLIAISIVGFSHGLLAHFWRASTTSVILAIPLILWTVALPIPWTLISLSVFSLFLLEFARLFFTELAK